MADPAPRIVGPKDGVSLDLAGGELMGGSEPPTPEQRQELAARYDLEVDPGSLPGLCREHGLTFPGAD